MSIFIIHPVRHATVEVTELVEKTASYLESQGNRVYLPSRDTNQIDPIGYRICIDNLIAMHASELVYVAWDGESQGCLFDLGMAFALKKPIKIISLPPLSKDKSFQNMIDEWSKK